MMKRVIGSMNLFIHLPWLFFIDSMNSRIKPRSKNPTVNPTVANGSEKEYMDQLFYLQCIHVCLLLYSFIMRANWNKIFNYFSNTFTMSYFYWALCISAINILSGEFILAKASKTVDVLEKWFRQKLYHSRRQNSMFDQYLPKFQG